MAYFTSDHFKLLNKWKGQRKDASNPEQKRAYDELAVAYQVTADWATSLKQELFADHGQVDVFKKPTNQANNFLSYNWAKIYPSAQAPKALAYTVGIQAEDGFVVKIDTVGLDDSMPVRLKYLALRGPDDQDAPFVAKLSASEGLKKSLLELVEWSANAIRRFRLSYDEVASQLGLLATPDAKLSGREADDAAPSAKQAFNRIYYGPPGTGKTYTLSELLKKNYQQVMTAVSDKEWQAQLINERIAHLTWWEAAAAALYDLDGSAKVAQLQAHPFIQAVALAKGRNKNIPQTLWGTLQHHTVENSTTVNSRLRRAPAVFDKMQDSTWRFAGDWQEVCTNLIETVKAYKTTPPSAGTVQRYSFVTFHQSYGYEEFVEGLRPVLSAEAEEGEIQYEIRAGVFKELCRRAHLTPNQRFAMVIDEINRGNISKIFGELITLIEPDKREGAENMVSVILPYSGESFSVPANVDIIGAMNTADRSLALLDTALRRRFEFVPVWPDVRDEAGAPLFGLRVRVSEEQVINIPRMLSVMNQRIEALYDRDHCIGHAYFTALAQALDGEERFAMLSQIFNHRIIPLLEEYFFEDWQKIRLVLADNQKPEHAQFVTESPNHEVDLERLFGNNHGLDVYATTPRYMVQDASFEEPDAYIGIYQKLIA